MPRRVPARAQARAAQGALGPDPSRHPQDGTRRGSNEAALLEAGQVFGHGRLADTATAGDLPLILGEIELQPQNIFSEASPQTDKAWGGPG